MNPFIQTIFLFLSIYLTSCNAPFKEITRENSRNEDIARFRPIDVEGKWKTSCKTNYYQNWTSNRYLFQDFLEIKEDSIVVNKVFYEDDIDGVYTKDCNTRQVGKIETRGTIIIKESANNDARYVEVKTDTYSIESFTEEFKESLSNSNKCNPDVGLTIGDEKKLKVESDNCHLFHWYGEEGGFLPHAIKLSKELDTLIFMLFPTQWEKVSFSDHYVRSNDK